MIGLALRLAVALVTFDAVGVAAQPLPQYKPDTRVEGAIRVWGSNDMGGLLERWERGFRKFHPDLVFVKTLKGTASAQFALHTNVADLALSGRELHPYEYYGIFRRSQLYPREFQVATGSLDVRGKSTAIGIFVHKDNPLAGLTLAQLDGIFGDQRTGGWKRIVWDESVARGPEGNIRRWGTLGLSGAWESRPIHVYGPPGIHPGGVSFFQSRVLGGSDVRNEELVEFADRAAMLAALASDPAGIAYGPLAYRHPDVKVLTIAESAGQPFVGPSRASVADRSYPLSRSAYIYVAPDTATGDRTPVDAKVREFLRYVLSREGQADVADEHDYFPLAEAAAARQRRLVDAPAVTTGNAD